MGRMSDKNIAKAREYCDFIKREMDERGYVDVHALDFDLGNRIGVKIALPSGRRRAYRLPQKVGEATPEEMLASAIEWADRELAQDQAA